MEENCEHYDVCGRKALSGHDGKCILHSENRKKHTEGYGDPLGTAIEKHIKENGPNFKHMSFVGGREGFNFRKHDFEERANFEEATFWGEARFIGTSFSKGVCFQSTIFEKGAHFIEDCILVGANFFNSSFEDSSSFDKSFLVECRFLKTDFEKDCSFNQSTFDDVRFEDCTIQNTSFRKSDLSKVTFEGVDFDGKCHNPEFSEATFLEVDFGGVLFRETARFDHTTVRGCTFKGATFENKATFRKAVFTKEASFRDAEFQHDALFQDSFEPAEDGRLEKVDFGNCYFQRKAAFSGSSNESRAFTDAEVNFTGVRLSPRAEVQFRYADLSQCRFLRTNLRDVEFTDVNWCEEASSSEWLYRIGLYDEVVERRKHESLGATLQEVAENHNRWSFHDVLWTTIDRMGAQYSPHWTLFELGRQARGRWHEVEQLYRQLKRNYEKRGDFPRGGDFHIGEKEARRKNSETGGTLKFLLYAYRALSKYGERALPPALWLVGLIFLFALFYQGATTCPTCEPLVYSEAIIPSLEASFYPVRSVGFQEYWPQFFSIVQRIISPILIALLALALRQRVKR
ncbi:uncharacterized protein YjbI with pentapeptide repeats [Salinibacter ruber]|uniref:pentapeptide repeat-containing protein n=1 Tax=Salinibacter ruber TaxID=146919 RepID=UPI0021671E02|nr:pentapeptide repeat-containing protein [Salinibacter ruber]MCS3860573.1 uncharacterized protein YjbI with pentapeptide repeats [Salinibacter ruber]